MPVVEDPHYRSQPLSAIDKNLMRQDHVLIRWHFLKYGKLLTDEVRVQNPFTRPDFTKSIVEVHNTRCFIVNSSACPQDLGIASWSEIRLRCSYVSINAKKTFLDTKAARPGGERVLPNCKGHRNHTDDCCRILYRTCRASLYRFGHVSRSAVFQTGTASSNR